MSKPVILKEGEAPGPFTMCWHWLKPKVLCVLKPGHTGAHQYSKFTVTVTKTKEK